MKSQPSSLASEICKHPDRLGLAATITEELQLAGADWAFRDNFGRLHLIAIVDGRANMNALETVASAAANLRDHEVFPPRAWLAAREIPPEVQERSLALHVHCRDFPTATVLPIRRDNNPWPTPRKLSNAVGGYYVVPLANLASVLAVGPMARSRVLAQGLKPEDFSIDEVQLRRSQKRVAGGRTVWDYVPLFMHPRNPALYYLKKHDWQDRIVVLEVSSSAVGSALATPGHAVRYPAQPLSQASAEHQRLLAQWPEWTLRSWWDNDRRVGDEKSSVLQAEVLVPTGIPPRMVQRIFVVSDQLAERVCSLAGTESGAEEIVVCPDLFFCGPREF